MATLLPRICLAFALFFQGSLTSVLAQDAILPHGDPRMQTVEQESPRDKETRGQRLKQQGQGSGYRVDGVPQVVAESSSRSGDSASQQNTGLSDPTVNPGQSAGMKKFRGRILKSENNIPIYKLDGCDIKRLISAAESEWAAAPQAKRDAGEITELTIRF